ncbi:MAG: tRNA lysidine(34) synthetase TilS [Dehalococcoidia bacterium]
MFSAGASLAPPRALVARVRRFIREGALIRPGDRVLAGVSGGPDSTCLLLTLAALRRSLGFDLHVAHFDHQLRGPRAAEREERFVRSLCQALAAPLVSGAGDVRAHARGYHQSVEEAARELRYRFLAQAARDGGCAIVAVGHTRDDQAETVLLHIVRGSGLRGLAAMAAASAWPTGRGRNTPRLVRPLLALSRDDTEACCREAGVEPLHDPSNRSQAHLRNRVRSELLPLLRDYNPRIEDALVRLAGAASSDIEALEALAAEALAGEAARDGTVRLDRKRLAALPEALGRHAVRLAVARLLGDRRNLSDRHVQAVLRAAEGPAGTRLDLPRGLCVEVRRASVVISPRAAPEALPANELALPVPGIVSFGLWRIEAELLHRAPSRLPDDPLTAYLDADACGASLSIRTRRPGDRFQSLGLGSPKKLQDFFVDAHVPRSERDGVPLVCGERGIAWVVGLRPAEWARLTPKTRRVLRVRAKRLS